MSWSWRDLVVKILTEIPPERLGETATWQEPYDDRETMHIDALVELEDESGFTLA